MQLNDFLTVLNASMNTILAVIIICPIALFLLYRFLKYGLVFRISLVIVILVTLVGIVTTMSTYAEQNYPEMYVPIVLFNIPFIMIIFFISVIYLQKTVFKPIKNLVLVNNQLANGNLSIPKTNWKHNDEIGSLYESVAQTADFLKTIISEISTTSDYLSSSSSEIASSSEEVNSASQEISSIAQQMSVSSSTQSEKMKELVNAIEALKNEFDQKFQKLLKTSDLIESISSQVNILALNASIEAARAGEYGRGFAVVAENIRQLSNNTKNSLTEVSDTVNDLQNYLNTSIENVGILANSVSSITEESAAGAEEATSATEEQAATMEELTAKAQELTDTSLRLNDLMNKFEV